MQKNLLVTLADESYIDQAKQLFSSVYWNAGWKGDYMLLAHEIPEEKLRWFKNKGILIRRCESLYDKEIAGWPIVVWSKFYLFTPEFKKWKNIIFLDVDIIVRASLDELTKIKGFAARYGSKLNHQFMKPKPMSQNGKSKKRNMKSSSELKKNYNLKVYGINSGVMTFDTDIIKEDTFSQLQKLFELYGDICRLADQSILSLFFYKKFIPLLQVYNCNVDHMISVCSVKPEKIKGIVLHFNNPNKPWSLKNPFYNEYKNNLDKAESINLKEIPAPRKIWTNEDIKKYCLYLRIRHTLNLHKYIMWQYPISISIDRIIGLFGIFLKNNFPKLYFILKKLKNGQS